MLIGMKITLNIRDDLLKKAQDLTGIKEKTSLVHLGLQALVQQIAREHLDRYEKKELSIEEACKLLGISQWTFFELLKEKQKTLNVDFEFWKKSSHLQ